MLELEVLILEFLAVDGLSTSAVPLGEVASLEHEVLDHPVELRSLIAKALLPGGESPEVLRCLRHLLAVKAHDDPFSLAAADADVEKNFVGDHRALSLLVLRSLGEGHGPSHDTERC